jgi:hypothetical protein
LAKFELALQESNVNESFSSETSEEGDQIEINEMEKERKQLKQLEIRKKILDSFEFFMPQGRDEDGDISIECDIGNFEDNNGTKSELDEDSFCLELEGVQDTYGDIFTDLRNLKRQLKKLPKTDFNPLKLYELCMNKVNENK